MYLNASRRRMSHHLPVSRMTVFLRPPSINSENGLINLIKLVNCPRINKFKRRSNVLINMISRLSKQCREKGNAQKRIEDELRESEMLDLPGWSKFKRSDWLTKSFKDLARFTLMN